MEKLASIDTCSSSCMDAASGSPSATRAIIVSEIIMKGKYNMQRPVSGLPVTVYLTNFLCFSCQLWVRGVGGGGSGRKFLVPG